VFTPPSLSCELCPRLAGFRQQNQSIYPSYHNAPVPSFGSLEAQLLVVGLAPGLHGANQTGRPFTGDYAGIVLYPALLKHGFARGEYGAHPNDGFMLENCRITNAVRCLPPENKPTPDEITSCRPFLVDEINVMPRLKVILALGNIAHASVCRTLGLKAKDAVFGHGAVHPLPGGRVLLDSYHTSRYNINTRRLTLEMFDAIVAQAATLVEHEKL
jgi:uracil-DNA glycosylase family 4